MSPFLAAVIVLGCCSACRGEATGEPTSPNSPIIQARAITLVSGLASASVQSRCFAESSTFRSLALRTLTALAVGGFNDGVAKLA